MKNLILSVSLFILIGLFSANAQITVTSDHVFLTGSVVYHALDTMPGASIQPGNAGAGQSWDFSALKNHGSDTMFIVNADWVSGYERFPNANIGSYFATDDSSWQFLSKTSSELKTVGDCFIETSGDTFFNKYESTIVTFPSTMGTSFTNPATSFEFSFPLQFDPDGPGPHPFVDTLKYILWQSGESAIDAWGSLTTPMGTYDCIRQKVDLLIIDTMMMLTNGQWSVISPTLVGLLAMDSISYDSTFVTYSWWTDNKDLGFSLVDMVYNKEPGSVVSVQWLFKPSSQNSINQALNRDESSIYPNPASEYLIIERNDQRRYILTVTDLNGKVFFQNEINNGYLKLSIGHLPEGIYFYGLHGIDRKYIEKGKFLILR